MNSKTTAQPRLRPQDYDDSALARFIPSIRGHARDRGAAIALIDGAARLTWAQTAARMDHVAARLAALGVGRGDVVASLGENSADHLIVYMAAIAAGACIAPLPSGTRPETLARMLANSDAKLIFASDRALAEARAAAARAGIAPPLRIDGLDAWLGAAPGAPPAIDSDLTDGFDMIFSSGTTGTPKGILHEHRFRLRQLERVRAFGFDADAVGIMATPMYSNTTLVASLPILIHGGTLVVMRRFAVADFLRLAETHRVTHAMLVPVQYQRLLDAPEFDSYDLSAFRAKLSTSAPLSPRIKRAALDRWPGKMIEIYGMTEGGVSTVLDCGACPDKLHTVGQVAAGNLIRFIDEAGAPLPDGEIGEIVGRSPSMMACYHNAPDKTAQTLWRDARGREWIRTGDMGRLDADGFLELLDRRKDMILSGGFNIYATDLEQVLARHEAVAEAAVLAVPSEAWGETPLGLVVLKPGARADAESIRDWANDRLGKTQRLSAVELRESFPRSEIGKILKRDLRAPYWPSRAGPGDSA